MKIKNQKNFVTAFIMEIIAIVCLITFLYNQETRYILAFLLTFIYGIISFYNSSNRKGSIEVASRNMDERDILLVMKTDKTTLRILNYILLAGSLISIVLYSLYHSIIYITLIITFTAIMFIQLAILFFVNIYYEKHA